MAYNERRSEEVDNVGHMYAHHYTHPRAHTQTEVNKPEHHTHTHTHRIVRAVSRLLMSSEPGVENLLRLTAARIAADDERHHQSNGALLECLPQELQDLIGECRASRQLKNQIGDGARLLADCSGGLFSLFLSLSRGGSRNGAKRDPRAACMRAAVACSESGGGLSAGVRLQLAAPVRAWSPSLLLCAHPD